MFLPLLAASCKGFSTDSVCSPTEKKIMWLSKQMFVPFLSTCQPVAELTVTLTLEMGGANETVGSFDLVGPNETGVRQLG